MNLKKNSIALVILVLMLPALLEPQTHIVMTHSNRMAQEAQIGSVAERAAEAGRITSIAQNEARNILRRAYDESVTQWEVSKHLEAVMRAEGADGPLAFATLTMSGDELELPHGVPEDDRVHIINPTTEPLVMIDMGCKYQNHSADVTRTYLFDSATQQMKDAYSAVLAAEEAAIAAIEPGVTIGELDSIVRDELSDFIGLPEVSFYEYWGHGVGFYVHEAPILWTGAASTTLEVGQVLALEPNLFFDDWAVRIEDIVIVTETGVEVLSNSPKTLENVTITEEDPLVTASITVSNYEYPKFVNVLIDVMDSDDRSVTWGQFFNGRAWQTMTERSRQEYECSYFLLEEYYSGFVTSVFRMEFGDEDVYFTQDLTASPENSTQHLLDSQVVCNSNQLIPLPIRWSFTHTDAPMIRLHFVNLTTNDGAQTILTDMDGHAVADYRSLDTVDIWSPWVAGSGVRLSITPISAIGASSVGFCIDMYEVALPADVPFTTPGTPHTHSNSTTAPTTTPPPPNGEVDFTLVVTLIVGIVAIVIVVVIIRDLKS